MESKRLFSMLAALAEPSRFHILQLVSRGALGTCCDRMEAYEQGCCVADVVAASGLSQPTVSHHLRVLAEAGLVRKEIRGPWTCYFPAPEAVEQLTVLLRYALFASGHTRDGEVVTQAVCGCEGDRTCEAAVKKSVDEGART